MEPSITARLAEHAAKVRYEDIPPEAIEKAKDCILDQIGVELTGSTLEWNKIAYRYIKELGGRGESTIVNYGTKAPALDAAFVNATFGQGCELDDVGFAAGGHLGAATVPVALALCERQRVSGKDFLAAVVVGCMSCSTGCWRQCGHRPESEASTATVSADLSVRWSRRRDYCT